ncbi:ribonuclease D [Dongshaea marina]|uniref:ribonuclease D n=1 Tax=Dongshaea marina TaxID=2047966 RepID=UPI000D3ECAA2|nr:ribonuclease D [Dongshaea marina]
MDYQLIENQSQLTELCQGLTENRLAIDTEFMRRRSFYPHPGLIQVANDAEVWLIDPLKVTDLTPLWDRLFGLEKRLVMHAPGEDLQLFLACSGRLPAAMDDTQLAAAFLGKGICCGLQKLLDTYLGIELSKEHTRTDWLARPLSPEQLDYAARDVSDLLALQEKLELELKEKGLLDWYRQETELQLSRAAVVAEPDDAYLHIRNSWQLAPKQLAVLKLLAAWRLKLAREKDLAVNFVVKEDALWEIARRQPQSMGQLKRLGLHPMELRRHGEILLDLVRQGSALAESDWPEPIKRIVDYPDYKAKYHEIRELARTKQEESGVAAELLASKKLIHQYLSWLWKKEYPEQQIPALLQGWRKSLFATLAQTPQRD